MIIGADVFKMPVFHSESPWNDPQLNKTEPLIQVPGMDVAFHYRIEL